ncbi:uncharacterized protein ACRADG_004741 [Cochliomyia hominivorax]
MASSLAQDLAEINPAMRTKFDDDLREIVEYLKLQMQCGFPEKDIPPLAPYQNEFVPFDFVKPNWRYIFLTSPIKKKTNNRLKGNLSSLVITGLNEFDVKALHWNNILHKISYDLNFPSLQVHSSYQLNGINNIFGTPQAVFGNGLFRLELVNLRVRGSLFLKPLLSGGLAVRSFNVDVDLEAVHSKSTGFMNSLIYTKLINAWIEEFIYLTFMEKNAVSHTLESLAVPVLNDLLHGISLIELIALITGLGEIDLPTEVNCN